MEQNSTLFQKDGKYFLQLDCENAKELSLKWDDKTYSFVKDGEKWILELPFSTAVNYLNPHIFMETVLPSGITVQVVPSSSVYAVVPSGLFSIWVRS